MFKTCKTDADTEYLASAIIRDAMHEKFRNVFGLDPVSTETNTPQVISEGKVPDTILASVDPDIAPILRASAVEQTDTVSGDVPEINGATLLYTLLDDQPASIALDSVPEYNEIEAQAVDSTVSAVSESPDINIEDGIAYLSQTASGIEIGVHIDNQGFAEELSHRVENSGGTDLDHDARIQLFDELLSELPGGDNNWVEGLRNTLLGVVGLTADLPSSQQGGDNSEIQNPAPGPEATTAPVGENTASVISALNL